MATVVRGYALYEARWSMTAAVRLAENDEDLGLRGIYRAKVPVDGCRAYYALTRNGSVVGAGIRVVWPGETEAEVVDRLRTELRLADPVRPTYLRLVEEPITLRDAIDLPAPAFGRWLYS